MSELKTLIDEINAEPEPLGSVMSLIDKINSESDLSPMRHIDNTDYGPSMMGAADLTNLFVDRPKHIIAAQDLTGLPMDEVLSAYDAVDRDPLATGPEHAARVKQELQRRQYKGVLDELKYGTAAGELTLGSSVVGTAGSVLDWFSKSPLFYPITRYGGIAQAGGEKLALRAREIGADWNAKAQELYRWSQDESLQPGKGGGFLGYAANVTGQTLPLMVASTLSQAVVPGGAFFVSAMSEGDNWVRQGIAEGKSPEELALGRIVVGTINGVIEVAQVGKVLQAGKGIAKGAEKSVMQEFAAAVQERAFKKIAATGGKLTKAHIEGAIKEGFEETAQQWVGMGMAQVSYGKDYTAQDYMSQGAQAGIGGTTAGFMLGTGTLVLEGATQLGTKQEVAASAPLKPMIVQEEQAAATSVPAESTTTGEKPDLKSTAGTGLEAANQEVVNAGEVATQGQAADIAGATDLPTTVAARSEGIAPQADMLWQRLKTPDAEFVPSNPAEADLHEAYKAGIIESPQDVREWMQPGITQATPKEVRSPDAVVGVSAKQAVLEAMLHDMDRASINSHERTHVIDRMQSPEAQSAFAAPDFYVQKVLKDGDALNADQEIGLTMHMTQLWGERDSLKTQEEGAIDPTHKAALKTQMARIDALLAPVINALDIGGSDLGAAMQIRTTILNRQMEPQWVRSSGERAKGAPLAEKESANLTKMAEEVGKLTKELDATKAQLDAQRAEAAAKQPRKRKQVAEKEGTTPEAARKKRLTDNYAKLKELLGAGC
jgi:hypothetical protein